MTIEDIKNFPGKYIRFYTIGDDRMVFIYVHEIRINKNEFIIAKVDQYIFNRNGEKCNIIIGNNISLSLMYNYVELTKEEFYSEIREWLADYLD